MMRALGLFKPEEWRLLVEHAKEQSWIEALPERKYYEEAYGHQGEAALRDMLAEEAIMHKFAAWRRGEAPEIEPQSWVARLFERIQALLERTANWMRGRGFNSADDAARLYGYDSAEAIFKAMDEGSFRQRQIERGETAPVRRNRLDEINDRLRELEPEIDKAYRRAQAENPLDVSAIALKQHERLRQGGAPGMTATDLADVMTMYDKQAAQPAPEKGRGAGELGVGQWPEELHLAEQLHQAAIEEGARFTKEAEEELRATGEALQDAANREQGYMQAVECLMGGRQ